MDFSLTKEQQLIQKAFREFCNTELESVACKIDEESVIPEKILKGLAELDTFGLPMPEEYGGAGAGYDSYVLAMEQISRVSPGVAVTVSAHTAAMGVIRLYANEEQKKKCLPPGCRGEHILSVAWTEPGTGSDPKQITATARPEGDYFVLNGTKRFISNADYPGTCLVFARETDSNQISCFIVEKWCEGYSISEPWEKIGQHGGQLLDVYLKEVKVPVGNRVGASGAGYGMLQGMISFGKIGVSSTALGNILAAYEEAVKYAKEKTHRGEPITKFQAMQLRIADLAIKYEAARWLVYRLGSIANQAIYDLGQFPKEAALTKTFVCDAAVEAAKIAVIVHASYGIMTDYKVTRIYRDAAIGPIIEGVEDMQKLIVAQYIV